MKIQGRVQKFRSVEEMAEAPVLVDPEQGFERFARQCARYFALFPRVYPRGVFRFGSIDEAQAARGPGLRTTIFSAIESRPTLDGFGACAAHLLSRRALVGQHSATLLIVAKASRIEAGR